MGSPNKPKIVSTQHNEQRAGTVLAVPAPEHSYTLRVVSATCEAAGYTLHACACGDSYKDNYVSALGHNYVQSGLNKYVCRRCGKVKSEDVTLPVEPIEPDPPIAEISQTANASASTGTTCRILKETVTEEHSYVYAGGRLMRETISVDGTVTTVMDFIYDESGRPFALKYSTNGTSFTTYYYVLNLQGDVVGLINSSGSYVAKYTYDAWGNLLSVTNASGTAITSSTHIANRNPLRYRGYYYDTETGFYYIKSRYYDPAQHRYLNADTVFDYDVGFPGYNLYAYCGNSPVFRIDVNGRDSEPADDHVQILTNSTLGGGNGGFSGGPGGPSPAGNTATEDLQDMEDFIQAKNAQSSNSTADVYTAPPGGGGVSSSVTVGNYTVDFGHGGRHLSDTSLSMRDVNTAIANDVVTKPFPEVGKPFTEALININGVEVTYRAFLLGPWHINVGTYFDVKP